MAYNRRSQLDTLLAANITDNSGGENTAARVRAVHANTLDSVVILEDAVAKSPSVTRVRVVDATGLDPATDYEEGDAVDGVTLAAGDLVLRAEPAAGSPDESMLNGVYIVPASGAAARHDDFAAYDDYPGALFVAREGALAHKPLICTSARGGTLDTDEIAIVQAFGDAAYKNTGTGSGDVAAANLALKDGDYPHLQEITDYDAVPAGFQTISSEDSSGVNNAPASAVSGFQLGRTLAFGADRAVQIAFTAWGSAVGYLRSKGPSGWSAWVRLADLNTESQPNSGGVLTTSKDLGGGNAITSGTVEVDPSDRAYQDYENGGAHTLSPASLSAGTAASCILDIVNVTGAGNITTSGWDVVNGDAFTTVVGDSFRCTATVGPAGSMLSVMAFQ